MKRFAIGMALAMATALALPIAANAQAPSGAIFTTIADGTEVNTNLYALKTDVYLNGGPGINAPTTAAGLTDGRYVFMVTNPSGSVLLSQDAAQCRQFDVVGGVIADYVSGVPGCTDHVTGLNKTDGSTTIQLMPYADTPNHGGVYKAWVEMVANYPASCLTTVDCGVGSISTCGGPLKHGFCPGDSKTDNFKVKTPAGEFDTQFFDTNNGNALLSGLSINWTDTTGAGNVKWTDPESKLEAHVEAPEIGTHTITITNQPGCTVTGVTVSDGRKFNGPGNINIVVKSGSNFLTSWHIYVYCN